MKYIAINIIPLGLLALAGFLIYLNRDGWGYCVFGAIVSAVYPSAIESSSNDSNDEDKLTSG